MLTEKTDLTKQIKHSRVMKVINLKIKLQYENLVKIKPRVIAYPVQWVNIFRAQINPKIASLKKNPVKKLNRH